MSHKQTAESFWARVKKLPGRNSCWEWQGSCNNTGYGSVAWHGKVYTAHRLAAWLLGLVVSPAMPRDSDDPTHILHKCDNRKCCRPSHWRLGTYSDNLQDCHDKARRPTYRGAAHANSKLTAATVEELRQRYAAGGISQETLAEQFGVSQTSVSLAVRRETYA